MASVDGVGDALVDAAETGDEGVDLGIGADTSPLAELASSGLLFARAKGIKSASTGEMFTAVASSTDVPFTEKLRDNFLSAASRVMTAAQLDNRAAAPSALSLFLGKDAGEAVEIIDTDGTPVTVAFLRDESAPKSVRRWIVGPVEAATATAATLEGTHDAVEEEWGAPLLIALLSNCDNAKNENTDNENENL